MILSGWKEIAQYLHCGIRTAQRWESRGLPIKRPFPGRRSHVVTDSERLDSWIQDSDFWRRQDLDLLANIQRTRELRAQVQRARETLHQKMDILRKELATLQARAAR